MPNHIKNKIELIGDINHLDALIKQFSTYMPAKLNLTHDEKLVICRGEGDFNFCWMDLSSGQVHDRGDLKQIGLPNGYTPEVKDAFLLFPDFAKVIPPPDVPEYRDEPSQDAVRNSPNWWYNWNVKNWGTKWGSYSCERPAINVFTFETAWSSVPLIIAAMSKAFPKVTIKYSWADEDTGHNCGKSEYLGGEVVSEFIPNGGTKEAYDIAFELRPYLAESYELVDGSYKYKEEED